MARRKYSDEYKKEAVAMTEIPGATITGVAKDLGINGHMLGRCCKQLEAHGEKAFPGQGHARDEELMQLKRERKVGSDHRNYLSLREFSSKFPDIQP